MKITGTTASTTTPRSDWNQTDPRKSDYIKNKPDFTPASHAKDTNNPHGVTIEQIGAAPADHAKDTNNPHGVTAEQIGAVGTQAIYVDSVEEITKSGYYELGVDVDGLLGLYTFRAVADAENNRIYLYGNTNDGNLQRIKSGAVWGEWEWETPPMNNMQEHRTTERLEGQPVFTKFVYFGALPANTSSYIKHNITGVDKILSCTLSFFKNSESYIAPYWDNGTIRAAVNVNETYVTVITTTDYSTYNGVVVLKYTKK